MRKIYENFKEIAEDFKNGENWTHTLSRHSSDECFTWQQAIMQFCEWLDAAGIKLPEDPKIYEKLWDLTNNGVSKWIKNKNDLRTS